jgi:CRP-like cAMP-binding protein
VLSERTPPPCGNSARPIGQDTALQKKILEGASNRLLSSLSRDQFDLLSPYISTELFDPNHILIEAGDEIDYVYFPLSGMLSLLAVLKDGKAIETATVGREGAVGAMAGLGVYISQVRVVVRFPAQLAKISASRFRKVAAKSEAIRDISIKYNENLLSQARITAACNTVHLIEPRFCRWLLQASDRAENDSIYLTQEFLAGTLGVRRTSVTDVARKVQDAGAIRYSRGTITILDRRMLERLSCECYVTLLEQS